MRSTPNITLSEAHSDWDALAAASGDFINLRQWIHDHPGTSSQPSMVRETKGIKARVLTVRMGCGERKVSVPLGTTTMNDRIDYTRCVVTAHVPRLRTNAAPAKPEKRMTGKSASRSSISSGATEFRQCPLWGAAPQHRDTATKVGFGPLHMFLLDFRRRGSVCRCMNESDSDQIAKGFAELTTLLEDAAALAVDGQSGDRTPESIKAVSEDLRILLKASVTKLAWIERSIDEFGSR